MNLQLSIKTCYFLVLFTGLMNFCVQAKADNMDNLAKSLISMRGEVEELQSELDMEKQSHKTKMDALSSQMADLSVENQRQEVAIEKLQQALEKYEQAREKAKNGNELLIPALMAAIDDLSKSIESGLPFKIEERLAELSALKTKLETRALDPHKVANRLWAFIEDEIRLTRENGVYSQTIQLGGEQRLVDVAKLGSMFLYFKASDDRVGKAVKQSGQWQFVELTSSNEKEQISLLFDSLKKQIRQGYFVLPNPRGS